MNKKIIYISVVVALVVGASMLVSAVVIKNPNDYYAFTNGFVDFTTNPNNASEIDITYPVRYIPVTASATYTFTMYYETTHIDLDQPSTIQSKMRQDITNDSISRGYNLVKIIIPDYNILPPLP